MLCIEIRELNTQALTQRRENSAASCKVLPPGAHLAVPMFPQSYPKPELMGPQNRHDGKHPDAMVKHLRALLDNTQDETRRAAIYNGMLEFTEHTSRNKGYTLDQQLHAMEFCIDHGRKVQLESFEVEYISPMCRCTGRQSWRRRYRRNDWVWAKQCKGRC